MHREAGRIPLLALRAWMGRAWMERETPAPIKAPGGSRGIANRKGTIQSLTLRVFIGRATGASRQRDNERGTITYTVVHSFVSWRSFHD